MNDKTLEILNQLAEKFGTTVEHLWGVLVKQAIVSAITQISLALLMVGGLVWLFRFVKKKTTKPAPTQNGRYTSAEWEEESAFLAWVVVFIAAILVSVQIYSAVITGATSLLNPEYWAFKQILP